jgi:NTE family protein
MKDITLALGGGGVKGNAHIGVLRVLKREGFNICAIAGTSIGGVVGAFYAFGYDPDEIEKRFWTLDPASIYHHQTEEGPSWLSSHGVYDLMVDALGDCTFTDLRLPFAVTSVDLETANLEIINYGKVIDAVMATIAVPGVFPPIEKDGRLLVDGGVLAPVPVGVARLLAPDAATVAVVLSPALDGWKELEKPRLLGSMPFLSNIVARTRMAQALNIFMRSIDIGGAMLTESLLKLEQPDVIIRPGVPHIGLLDSVDIGQVARLGEAAARLALPSLNEAVSMRARLRRRLHKAPPLGIHLPNSADFQKGGDHVT